MRPGRFGRYAIRTADGVQEDEKILRDNSTRRP